MKKKIFEKIKKFFKKIEKVIFKIPVIKKKKILRQLTKFLVAGGFVTLIDFLLYFLLTRFSRFWDEHFLWANFISMSTAAIMGYFLNKKWVFKNKEKAIISQYIKFWIFAGIGGMLIYQIIFAFLTKSVNIYDIISKAISAFLVVFLRFIIQKYWIFN